VFDVVWLIALAFVFVAIQGLTALLSFIPTATNTIFSASFPIISHIFGCLLE